MGQNVVAQPRKNYEQLRRLDGRVVDERVPTFRDDQLHKTLQNLVLGEHQYQQTPPPPRPPRPPAATTAAATKPPPALRLLAAVHRITKTNLMISADASVPERELNAKINISVSKIQNMIPDPVASLASNLQRSNLSFWPRW